MKKIFGLLAFVLFGCSQPRGFQDPQYAPSPLIASSFAVAPTGAESGLKADQTKISISKSALEKEFLLQVQLISQAIAPRFSGLQSRIVSFRQQQGKVYLIETSNGHNFATNLPQTLLLAEFPILEETDTQLTIDFNKGMSEIFVEGDWKAGDFGSNDIRQSLQAVKTVFSYLLNSDFKDNHLIIRQLAQIQRPTNGIVVNETVEVQYYLSPYLENKKFKPTVIPDTYDRFGFFEVTSLINNESGTVTYASKFDVNKPIVYAISANTPEEFKQAVKDGVLYWNRALGKDLISVIEAPEGVSAPFVGYNVIQWVDWASAGFAYADAQMDPRTGEILHQQIYFTNAWASYGKREARQADSFVGINAQSKREEAKIGLAGFRPQVLCDLDLDHAVAQQMGEVLSKGLTAEQTLKAAQDLIRQVVAHEVGHTMGLRHNFAGSLAANFPIAQRDQLFKQYLRSGSAPEGIVTSSSVMDYQFPLESILSGDGIAKGKPAGEYDQKAMQVLYMDADYKSTESPFFCTDSHAYLMGVIDCRPYDAGNSEIEWIQYRTQTTLKNLPMTLLFAFQNAKAPLFGARPTPISQVAPDAKSTASSALMLEQNLLSLFPAKGKLLSVSRSFEFSNGTNEDEVRSKLETYVLGEIKRLGGLSAILTPVDLGFADREYARFEALLSDPKNLRGLNLGEKEFSFSEDDVAAMKQTVKRFYRTLQKEFVLQEATMLAGAKDAPKMKAGELSEVLSTYLLSRATEILFTTTKTPILIKKTTGGDVWAVGDGQGASPIFSPTVITYTLPQFAYDFDVRQKAASFLRADRSEDLAWAFQQRSAVGVKYAEFITAAFAPIGTMTGDVKTELKKYPTAPQPLISWLMDVLTIKAAL